MGTSENYHMAKIAGLVLAAGLSSRMGEFKLLLAWGDNKPLIWHLVETLKMLPLEPLILVTGHRAEALNTLFADSHIQIIYNPDYAKGEILSSLKTGFRTLSTDVDAILVFLGDMPLISPSTIQKLMDAYQPEKIIVPSYEQKRGHPVMFTRRFFEEILALEASAQPRAVLQAHPDSVRMIETGDEGILIDINTPQDYEKYQ
jgi:molybdenum cofactor cytidylyltransferase